MSDKLPSASGMLELDSYFRQSSHYLADMADRFLSGFRVLELKQGDETDATSLWEDSSLESSMGIEIDELLACSENHHVAFDLDRTAYHENGRDLSLEEEQQQCWYDEKSLAKMKKYAEKDAKKLESKTLALSLKRRPALLSSALKKSLTAVLSDCSNIKSEAGLEHGINQTQRQIMTDAYQRCDTLWGLERSLFGKADGSSRRLLILEHAQRQITPEMSADQKQKVYSRLSMAVSRPSRAFGREIGQAQQQACAAALLLHD